MSLGNRFESPDLVPDKAFFHHYMETGLIYIFRYYDEMSDDDRELIPRYICPKAV